MAEYMMMQQLSTGLLSDEVQEVIKARVASEVPAGCAFLVAVHHVEDRCCAPSCPCSCWPRVVIRTAPLRGTQGG